MARSRLRVLLAATLGLFLLTGGTIAEQRSRLPPPAECTDPVVGQWQAHDFNERYGHWYMTELRIGRVEGSKTQLEGSISVDMWLGTATTPNPLSCDRTSLRYVLHQDAVGSIHENEVAFGGTRYRVEKEICGRFTTYNLDQFSGIIDPEIQESNQ